MDETDLNRLSPEDQQRWKDYEAMFATAGWQRLQTELRGHVGNLVNSALTTVNDEKSLYFAKGQLHAAMAIVNLEVGMQTEFASKLQELDADEQEAADSQGTQA